MNNNDQDKQDLQKESPLWVIGFLIAMVIAEVMLFYHYSNNFYRADDFTTMQVNITLAPKFINKKRERRYETAGKGYNCWFWITEDPLLMILDNEKLRSKVEAIKVGDIVEITIYKQDTVNLISIYRKMSIMGLSTMNETIYTPDQVISYGQSRQKNWIISVGFLVLLFLILSIRALLIHNKEAS